MVFLQPMDSILLPVIILVESVFGKSLAIWYVPRLTWSSWWCADDPTGTDLLGRQCPTNDDEICTWFFISSTRGPGLLSRVCRINDTSFITHVGLHPQFLLNYFVTSIMLQRQWRRWRNSGLELEHHSRDDESPASVSIIWIAVWKRISPSTISWKSWCDATSEWNEWYCSWFRSE